MQHHPVEIEVLSNPLRKKERPIIAVRMIKSGLSILSLEPILPKRKKIQLYLEKKSGKM